MAEHENDYSYIDSSFVDDASHPAHTSNDQDVDQFINDNIINHHGPSPTKHPDEQQQQQPEKGLDFDINQFSYDHLEQLQHQQQSLLHHQLSPISSSAPEPSMSFGDIVVHEHSYCKDSTVRTL